MAAKKKKEMKSSKAEDALEAKIRMKKSKAAASASSSRRAEEEEKVEEDRSYSSYDDDDEEVGYSNHSRSRGVTSGIPVADNNNEEESNALFTRGGGDVRNRPPPNPLDNSSVDPLRKAELEKEKNKKNVNQRYQDMHESGQWGALSKWEKYGIGLLTVGAIVTAVVLGIMVSSGGEKNSRADGAAY